MDFVDSNILLYAIGRDRASAEKRATARSVLAGSDFTISVQVLGEFFTNAIRADKAGLTEREATLYCKTWTSSYRVASLTLETFHRALETRSRYQLSYWDAMILAAAKESGCIRLLTEDLNHGQDYGGVTAHNPFQ